MTADAQQISDDEIRALVARLSRPDGSGGRVIERAAIMAEGSRSGAILDWLEDASWVPEQLPEPTANRGGSGLHGMRREAERGQARAQPPRRYVSPRSENG
ncbi:MAG TPA: hypothetical protein VI318_22610 [Baekduia sp.]